MNGYAVVKVDMNGLRYSFSVWHPTESEAKAEAIRLSEKENGAKFAVLKVVGLASREPNPVVYREV